MTDIKKTPIYQQHVDLGAKMTPFGGYLMPVQYAGINAEHAAVRSTVGLFDVSHMGEFVVSGPDAERYLQKMTINDVSTLEVGQAQYSAMCRPDGGIVDDLLIYRRENDYLLVVNAANIDGDFEWLSAHVEPNVSLTNISDQLALIAVQGPKSRALVEKGLGLSLADLPFYHFITTTVSGMPAIVSRTGYTGELGYELYIDPTIAAMLWDELLSAGQEFTIQPAGLGARDTLRLEMKYCLYGNDITTATNPLESGLGWITKLGKGEFIGSDVLTKIKEDGPSRRLVCFKMLERAVPRHDYKIFIDGQEVGIVTSGTQSPTLKAGIGLGFVARGNTKSGTNIQIEIRGKMAEAEIVKPPFVDNTSIMD